MIDLNHIDDLARFGCTEEDVRAAVERGGPGVGSAALRSVLEHHGARARVYFSRAARELPAGDARSFVPAEIMHAVYFDLLRRIEADDYDVFSGLIKVPRGYQAWLAARTWVSGRRPR